MTRRWPVTFTASEPTRRDDGQTLYDVRVAGMAARQNTILSGLPASSPLGAERLAQRILFYVVERSLSRIGEIPLSVYAGAPDAPYGDGDEEPEELEPHEG